MQNQSSLIEQATTFEREAHMLLAEQKIQAAFEAFDKAASKYRDAGEHLKAALCFASAATCWNTYTGRQPLKNAATRNHLAAQEALKTKNYGYAKSLFREAAILYEKEGDGEHYSLCFIGSHEAEAKHSWEMFLYGRSDEMAGSPLEVKIKDRAVAFFRWIFNHFNRLVWGYGERPLRTFFTAWFVILGSALIYDLSGHILVSGLLKPINYLEALYFSLITFATVGYGDYLPLGWVRIIAVFEGLSGIFLAPLFLVALTRRYLRMYR